MKTKTNPLSYLGWLGVLGLFGVMFVPVLIPFLLCFSFFSYSRVIPDELFWRNVNRAAARGFWTVFGLDTIIAVVMFGRGMSASWLGHPGPDVSFEGNLVTMGTFVFDQFFLVFLMFFVSLTVMILVFTISMMRFKKQEKKLLAEDAE